MEHIHNLIAATEQKVRDIELEIQKTVNTHLQLTGYLSATKEALVAAQAIIDAVSPCPSPTGDSLNTGASEGSDTGLGELEC